jgi:transcriptional regulator with XRE-family HTH domain
MDLRAALDTELKIRRTRNPRYSLRAFSRSLGVNHGTLSQILRSERRLTTRSILEIGARLGLSESQLRDACLASNCDAIANLVSDPRFRADARWIAMMTGIPLDEVSVALHWLLHTRRLVMVDRHTWKPERCPIP